jgi:PucR family transcriptional regulator, purine catabolism regulatory protein
MEESTVPITVDELLGDSRIGATILATGELSRVVRWVHSTETADPTPYLRGGEVVLTDGLWMQHGTGPEEYVRRLRKIDVAALGFAPPPEEARVVRELVPPELVLACEQLGLVLFTLPPELPFIAVSEVFFERVTRDAESALLANIERNKRFLDAARTGHGPGHLVGLLAAELAKPAWLAGRHGEPVADCPHRPDPADRQTVADAITAGARGGPVVSGKWLVFPVPSIDQTNTFLAVAGDDGVTLDQRAIVEQVLPILGVEMVHSRIVVQTKARFAGELFDLVLSGEATAANLAARLHAFGLDPAAALVAIVAEADDLDVALEELEAALTADDLPALSTIRSGQVMQLVPCSRDPAQATELAARLHARVGMDLTLGVGSIATNAGMLRASLIEARHACRFARLRDSRHGSYADVGSHKLLLDLLDADVLHHFSAALLRPVRRYDEQHDADLLQTLEAFLSNEGHWQATADTLHVHVNTLRNRLTRIEELTGRNIATTEARVDLYLALRARTLLRDEES